MARKTKEEAAETRTNVLMAALDLFAEKGYSRTTLGGIAKRIGMTRGAVYWHFDNKEAHSALYDTERTAELFCFIVNRYAALGGWPLAEDKFKKAAPQEEE